jgi:CheY-like chemotaxis protein
MQEAHDVVTKGSVLVVDDEVNLCRIIGAKLARSGYNVVTVHDGLQAVEKVRDSDFDVVLLDLILPKMDGLTALAAIRGMRDTLPVIVMTACENNEVLEQAKNYGVSAYVNKPFDLDTLVSLVSNTFRSAKVGGARKMPESTVLFGADQPITLEIQNGCGARLYLSRISGKDDRTLSVAAPRSADGPIEVPPRTSVKIGLATRDALYSFTTYVLRTATEPENVLVLEKPSVIYRVQRREHPRSDIRMPVAYAPCEDNGETEPHYADGETRDLSLGGACIVVPEEILPGEMIRLALCPKSDKNKVVTTACVVRSRPSVEPDTGYTIGCRFISTEGPLQKLLAE